MCGVNGIFAYHPAASIPNRREFLLTRDAMQARGPDGSGEWWSAEKCCALGNRRLSIIDLSDRAHQPIVSEDGKLAITFNGEIYKSARKSARKFPPSPTSTAPVASKPSAATPTRATIG